jgi:hypothetical protein
MVRNEQDLILAFWSKGTSDQLLFRSFVIQYQNPVSDCQNVSCAPFKKGNVY